MAGSLAAISAQGGCGVPALVADSATDKRLRSLAMPQSAATRPKRGLLTYRVQAKVEFVNGATDSVEMRSGPLSYFGRERCTSIPEQHLLLLVRGARREFSVRTDLRYRPSRIKSVSATVSREPEAATQTETFTPSFHIYPTRRGKDGDVKSTREFIAGRVKGEALRSARRCKNIVTVGEISRPAENDRSDYAQGFELGWGLAGSFLTATNDAMSCRWSLRSSRSASMQLFAPSRNASDSRV